MSNTDANPEHEPDTNENVENEAQPEAVETPGDDPQAQIEALQAEMASQKDRMMRALAEAENTRKRALKDREDAIKFAAAGFAKDLLDFSDNFRRALEAIPEDVKSSDDVRMQNIFSGLEAMERELLSVFEKNKIKKIIPLDEPFNPNFHEVMFEAPVLGKIAGTIIEVIEPGYVLHDRLLRAAKVGIAKATDGEPEAGHQVDTQA
ncbi:MAG: nucleotide exchange factor GrpE [Pseudomonadota bacterium]